MDDAAFEVRPSRIHGSGLYALSNIPARRKMGELGGERITVNEGRRRARGSDCVMIVEFADGTALDASRCGSHFRHVNHSCEPNAFMRSARGRVEFYSLREIGPGEELTCDYGVTHHEGTLACRCRSLRCRGRI
jgi:SET domain-containing protein